MANEDRKDQALDSIVTTSATAADVVGPGAAPVPGGAGESASTRAPRPFARLDADFSEDEAERLAALRKENTERRLQNEQHAERHRAKQREMAKAYKKRADEQAQKSREARRQRLADLHAQSRSTTHRSVNEGYDSEDEEYLELLKKYGNRVRVPLPPPDLPTDSPRRERSIERKPGLPRRPGAKSRPGAVATPRKSLKVGAEGHCCAPKACSAAGSGGVGPEAGQPILSMSVPGGGTTAHAMPGRLSTGVVCPNSARLGQPPSSARGSVADCNNTALPIIPEQHARQSTVQSTSLAGAVPEPERPLMPRKENLRRKQQALMKETNVVFYRRNMKEQFDKILMAAEVGFNDTVARREQASWNLAKPMSISEIKHLCGSTAIQ